MTTSNLRKCPICKTKVEDTKLGLRDYNSWVADLPGKQGFMDVDALLEKNGRFLVLEYKPPGEGLPLGQRITLKALVKTGLFTVWVVWHKDGFETCQVAALDAHGLTPFTANISVIDLHDRVHEWLDAEVKEATPRA